MRIKRINKVTPDRIAGSNVYDVSGRCVLKRGEPLTAQLIGLMGTLGVEGIYVQDHDDGANSNLFDSVLYEKALLTFAEASSCLDSQYATGDFGLSIEKVESIIDELLSFFSSEERIAVSHLSYSPAHEHLPFHCVNVCIYSLLTGIELGLGREHLIAMGTGAFMHDVGLLLAEKGQYLREDEFSRQQIMAHSWRGYELLKTNPRVSLESLYIVLQHHERFDGSGYPQGLRGNQIPEICRIVAIADCYDALTSNRPYRQRILPFEAMEYLQGDAADTFDQAVVSALSKRIFIYPVGLEVVLNNGEHGVVIGGQPGFPSRPLVRVHTDKEVIIRDLVHEQHLFVELVERDRE